MPSSCISDLVVPLPFYLKVACILLHPSGWENNVSPLGDKLFEWKNKKLFPLLLLSVIFVSVFRRFIRELWSLCFGLVCPSLDLNNHWHVCWLSLAAGHPKQVEILFKDANDYFKMHLVESFLFLYMLTFVLPFLDMFWIVPFSCFLCFFRSAKF